MLENSLEDEDLVDAVRTAIANAWLYVSDADYPDSRAYVVAVVIHPRVGDARVTTVLGTDYPKCTKSLQKLAEEMGADHARGLQ